MNRQLQEDIVEAMPQLIIRMVYKLGVHAAKGVWTHKPLEVAIAELYEEVDELRKAIAAGAPYEEIVDECADVGNMALIISHIYSQLPLRELAHSAARHPEEKQFDAQVVFGQCGYISQEARSICSLPHGHKDGHIFEPYGGTGTNV